MLDLTKEKRKSLGSFYTPDSLASKVCLGIHLAEMSSTYNMWIPQIDWSNIHINQKELWDKGDYDNAVLSEMSLKWNTDKTVIVKGFS